MPDLDRFVAAQADVYDRVVRELTAGRKQSHWMWFVFPQIAGLGGSAAAILYAIADRAEASAFLAHPLLGTRLRKCSALVMRHAGTPLRTILDSPDDLKFHSSMTLFDAVAPDDVFADALRAFVLSPDPATLSRLG